ncbi:hypothetical protein [Edaphovirga cremea]|uniref:hypothetical protein n=1 Tax=Edaphovirga cremea TaxID=2267246 RepID=UPI000DEED625|nr:hypothetical protein [Edaphovirga cremea]
MLYKNKSSIAYGLFKNENFPDSIVSYLDVQSKIIASILVNYKGLLEVGCGKAENLPIAVQCGVSYLGVDPVLDYVSDSLSLCEKENAQVVVGYAENIKQIIADYNVYDFLLLYPFNCIGNMENYIEVCKALTSTNSDYIIFSYSIDEPSVSERIKYYSSCELGDLRVIHNSSDIQIISSEGLSSRAFAPSHLKEALGASCNIYSFANIGLLYTNLNLDPIPKEIVRIQ